MAVLELTFPDYSIWTRAKLKGGTIVPGTWVLFQGHIFPDGAVVRSKARRIVYGSLKWVKHYLWGLNMDIMHMNLNCMPFY